MGYDSCMESETLAQRLKRLRLERELDVAELSTRSGLSKPYIWQIEEGRRKTPSGEKLLKLASGLGVTVGELLGAEEGITREELAETPEALQQFVKSRKKALDIRREDVAMLRGIHYRGKRPGTPEDYELVLLLLRRILD